MITDRFEDMPQVKYPLLRRSREADMGRMRRLVQHDRPFILRFDGDPNQDWFVDSGGWVSARGSSGRFTESVSIHIKWAIPKVWPEEV